MKRFIDSLVELLSSAKLDFMLHDDIGACKLTVGSPNQVSLYIYPHDEVKILRFYIPALHPIPSTQRERIKSHILGYNSKIIYGALSIPSRSPVITYGHCVSLEDGMITLPQLNDYLAYINFVCTEIKTMIDKLHVD
jgi:hypothetical protein